MNTLERDEGEGTGNAGNKTGQDIEAELQNPFEETAQKEFRKVG